MKMVRDPVCNMEIDEKKAVGASEHEGVTYYFCSPVCKDEFDKDPGKYVFKKEK
jgi:YHS domain-containing protein